MIEDNSNITTATPKKTILIIDDEVYIRKSAKSFLEDYSFKVIEAENGRIGLEKSIEEKPDLILCDLRMPEMDGLEVLAAVTQSRPETPIIIVSGAGNIKDTVKTLRLGAWDYIIKPIQNMDVLLHAIDKALERANFIEEKRQYQTSLEKANKELKDSLDVLNQTQDQLVQSEKMAALGELVAGVAHEINTPVGIGVTAASFLDAKTKELKKIYKSGNIKKSELESYLKTIEDISSSILINMERAAELISSFKQIAVDQSIEKSRFFKLKNYIDGVLLSLKPKFKDTNHSIKIKCSENIEINSFPSAFYQILNNLILNTLFHGFKNMDKGEIDMVFNLEGNDLTFIYKDDGAGMSQDQCIKIFDPFFTTMRGQGGTGLGMSIVFNLITQTLKGSIECESSENNGIKFIIQIPVLTDPNS
ncbi:MAG: response regulator [Desulfobacteraceae bacterium]|nr:response regulator [Desulfobacteraceae bacterium]